MKNYDEIERMLAETTKPKVIEGPHKLQLKYSLMHQMRKENVPMKSWRKTLAWVACLVLIAAVGGWAGQKAYKSFIVYEKVINEEEIVNPDGSKGSFIQTISVQMSSDDPAFTEEKARKDYEEIQKLISEGKGELLEIKDTEYGKVYIYKFVLSDGEDVAWGTHRPIGSPEKDTLSYQEILDLLEQGKGELIEEKELDSGGKVYLYKITRSDGTSFTFGSATPLHSEK